MVFSGIDHEEGGDAEAAEGLIKLLGVLDGDVPVLLAASEQRGDLGHVMPERVDTDEAEV